MTLVLVDEQYGPCALSNINYRRMLTRLEWYRLQFTPPFLGDLDQLFGLGLRTRSVTLLVRMADERLGIVLHDGVHNVEEVGPVR